MILEKGSIVKIGKATDTTLKPLSEHNRQAWSVSFERFGTTTRMVDATARTWHVADKRTWATSWTDLPHRDSDTVDKAMGGENLMKFYTANPFAFNIEVRNPNGSTERVLVLFKDFDYSVKKRGVYEFWDVSFSVEEV